MKLPWVLFGLMLLWHWADKLHSRKKERTLECYRKELREERLRLWNWERQLIHTENHINDSKKPE